LEQRREILRAIRAGSNTNIDSDFKPYSDTYHNGYTNDDAYHITDAYGHDHTQCKPHSNTDWNANSYSYTYTYTYTDANLYAVHGEMYTYAETATHSGPAALMRSITILVRKLSVCESSGNENPTQNNIDTGLTNRVRTAPQPL
jgi:hypothetical protein